MKLFVSRKKYDLLNKEYLLLNDNYEELNKQGFAVNNPEEIDKHQYEGIIIANMFYRSRQQIKNFINKKVNTKIFEIEENFIFSEESLMGFGL